MTVRLLPLLLLLAACTTFSPRPGDPNWDGSSYRVDRTDPLSVKWFYETTHPEYRLEPPSTDPAEIADNEVICQGQLGKGARWMGHLYSQETGAWAKRLCYDPAPLLLQLSSYCDLLGLRLVLRESSPTLFVCRKGNPPPEP